LLAEQFGRAQNIQDEVSDYVSDLKDELRDLKNFRFWVTVFTTLMSVALFLIFLHCVLNRPDWFNNLNGTLQVSVLAGLGGRFGFSYEYFTPWCLPNTTGAKQ
jgi:hypothetical protein